MILICVIRFFFFLVLFKIKLQSSNCSFSLFYPVTLQIFWITILQFLKTLSGVISDFEFTTTDVSASTLPSLDFKLPFKSFDENLLTVRCWLLVLSSVADVEGFGTSPSLAISLVELTWVLKLCFSLYCQKMKVKPWSFRISRLSVDRLSPLLFFHC